MPNHNESSQPSYRLGDLLLTQQLITQAQLQQALLQQQESGDRLGAILLQMEALSAAALKRTLSKQRWLRPCATCFALMSPISTCFASNDDEHTYQHWTQTQQWQEASYHSVKNHSSVDLMKFAAETAWGIYQGEAQAGEWRYSISKPLKSDSYQLQMSMRF